MWSFPPSLHHYLILCRLEQNFVNMLKDCSLVTKVEISLILSSVFKCLQKIFPQYVTHLLLRQSCYAWLLHDYANEPMMSSALATSPWKESARLVGAFMIFKSKVWFKKKKSLLVLRWIGKPGSEHLHVYYQHFRWASVGRRLCELQFCVKSGSAASWKEGEFGRRGSVAEWFELHWCALEHLLVWLWFSWLR